MINEFLDYLFVFFFLVPVPLLLVGTLVLLRKI